MEEGKLYGASFASGKDLQHCWVMKTIYMYIVQLHMHIQMYMYVLEY